MNNRRDFITKAGLGLTGIVGWQTLTSGTKPEKGAMPSESYINVLKHKVVADGVTKNTKAINELIEKTAQGGGGTLYFPPGIYLTGAIHLKSNITLHLEAGSVVRFSTDFDDYLPMVQSRWQGVDSINFSPLIYAYQASNISITGRGTFDGGGAVWWDFVLQLRKEFKETGQVKQTKWQEIFYQYNQEGSDQSFGFMRPSLFQAYECQNILIEGVQFLNSPFWTIHLVTCENAVVDRVWIHNEDSPNTDGINPESSKNVRISNCYIHASDDCITIKSGKTRWARENAKPCENITVTNCVMTSGAGGIGIGSEMSAGVRRVVVSNCVFENTHTGIHIKTNRERGGIVEDVFISNIVMNNIFDDAAIWINMEYWIQTKPGPVNENTPRFRNIHISNVTGVNLKRSIDIIGLEERSVENITLSNIHLSAKYGMVCKHAGNIVLSDIQINDTEDTPFLVEQSHQVDLKGLRSNVARQGEPCLLLNSVQEVTVDGCRYNGRVHPFLEVAGDQSQRIYVLDSRLKAIPEALKVRPNVPMGAVEL